MIHRTTLPAALLLLALLGVAAAPDGHAQVRDSSLVIYHYHGRALRDSHWGKLALLQHALNQAGTACRGTDVEVDGVFGAHMAAALDVYGRCHGRAPAPSDSNGIADVPVSQELWRMLLSDSLRPDVHERAFVLVLSHEATDYDRVEWNYGTGDDHSALTWGPFGATVGYGNEVREILRALHHSDSTMLPAVFGDDFPAIDSLMRVDAGGGYAVLQPVYADTARRARVAAAFRALGALPAARAAYDGYALASNGWLRPALRRLYTLIPNASATATEIDYAFFLDLAVHVSITSERIERCVTQLAERAHALGRPLASVERRRVIARTIIPARRQADRMGRNVVYYVDGIGEENLTAEERAAWLHRTGRRASDCGLSDERTYVPVWLR